jgi:hypothetical protein
LQQKCQGLKYIICLFGIFSIGILLPFAAVAQVTLSGTVYDSTGTLPVKDVLVKSGAGKTAITDTLGKYSLLADMSDSVYFIYNNKTTARYAVSQMKKTDYFDIALHIRVKEKFKTLSEVKVYRRSYAEDSIANRERYEKLFAYKNPVFQTSIDPVSGGVGLDPNALINAFRFRRNKQLRKMQERLEQEEQEKFINYRFSKATVRRITRLQGAELDVFMKMYRPDYDFTASATLVEFYQHILNCSYQFKKDQLIRNRQLDMQRYRQADSIRRKEQNLPKKWPLPKAETPRADSSILTPSL